MEQKERVPSPPWSIWSELSVWCRLIMSDVWSRLIAVGNMAAWEKESHGFPAQTCNNKSSAHSVLWGAVESASDWVA